MAGPLNTQELLNSIVKAAAENPKLKQKLLKNPKKVIEFTLNTKLPADFEVAVFEDTPKKLNIVLPPASGEISEVQLSSITGGLGLLNLDDRLNLLLSDEKLLL